MSEELYKKHRPTKLQEIIGQKEAVATLVDMVKRDALPHFLLFSGPSGVGKTSLARILKNRLQCEDMDYSEINAASSRGIDMVRDIEQRMGLSAIGGARMWCIDEAHKLTTDAQNSFLKPLEDTPKHVYFVFCTTDPSKLVKTIVTRATQIVFKAVSENELQSLVLRVAKFEDVDIDPDVSMKIAEASEGSPRKALVILHQIMGIKDKDTQLKAIESADAQIIAFNIAQKLIDSRVKWPEMADLLKLVEDEPETIRWVVLSYATKVLLSGGKSMERAAKIIDNFRDNFYDSKKAGLAISCFNVVNS